MPDLFADAPIPLEAQLACVERELGFRYAVYKRRVDAGKMKQSAADQEIAAMTAVRNTLRGLIAAAPKQAAPAVTDARSTPDGNPF